MSLRQPASLLALLGVLLLAAPQVEAANIVFQDDEGDLTFYYNSAAQTWATVFRAKGVAGEPTTTVATGLTAPFNSTSTPATWTPGIVGNIVADPAGETGDYTFTSLTTQVNTATQVTVGSVNYLVSSAEGSPFLEGAGADLGIRTRLRENFTGNDPAVPPATNQFASFNLRLRPNASTFNGGPLVGNANVSLLNWSGTSAVPQIDTATNLLTANFGNYEHVHRNWGFSQYGNYALAFDLEGVGGTYGSAAPVGTATINFAVAVPEPGTVSLAALGLLGVAGSFHWLRRRHRLAAPADALEQA